MTKKKSILLDMMKSWHKKDLFARDLTLRRQKTAALLWMASAVTVEG